MLSSVRLARQVPVEEGASALPEIELVGALGDAVAVPRADDELDLRDDRLGRPARGRQGAIVTGVGPSGWSVPLARGSAAVSGVVVMSQPP
jgi:hypothetical protein